MNRLKISHLLSIGLEPSAHGRATAARTSELDFSDIPDGNWRCGDYELLEELCRNGIGLVYRARKQSSNRLVALKRLPAYPGPNAEAARCLQSEAETVANLHHPCIPAVFEVGTGEDGLPFYSMKLAATNLADRLRDANRQPLDTRQAVEMMTKVALAVEYAHEQGVIHAELRPGNILLDVRGEPLIANFGFIRPATGSVALNRSPSVYNTPDYFAPEQIGSQNKNVKITADIFSLGAILFELLAQKPGLPGEQAWKLARKSSSEAVLKLRLLVADPDPELEKICARCLEYNPAARFQSAGELAANLQSWLARPA